MSLERIFICPDVHVPYHDKRAWALVMKVMGKWKPHHVVLKGDFMDMYKISDHVKDPARFLTIDDEIAITIGCLKQVKALGAKNNVYVFGNHEDRLRRELFKKMPELYNHVKLEKMLKLDELGFKYIMYKEDYKIGKQYVTHDTGTAGKNAANTSLDTYQDNIWTGHTHRMKYTIENDREGEEHISASFGWLGDVSKIDYMVKVKCIRYWNLGFGVAYLDTATQNVYSVPVPIIGYTCVVEGKLYSG